MSRKSGTIFGSIFLFCTGLSFLAAAYYINKNTTTNAIQNTITTVTFKMWTSNQDEMESTTSIQTNTSMYILRLEIHNLIFKLKFKI